MIEFSGKLQGKSRQYIFRQERKHSIIGATIAAIIATVVIVIVAVLYDWLLLVGLLLPPALVLASIFAKPEKSVEDLIFPTQICIDNSKLYSRSPQFEYERELSQVYSVIDFGEFYQIVFDAENKCPKFICQKNLITQGTIEDFEKLFEEKIIRK